MLEFQEPKKLIIQNEIRIMRNEILEKGQLSYTQKKIDRPLNKYDNSLKEFIIHSIYRSMLASMIYGFSRNKGEGISFSKEAPLKTMQNLEKSKKPPCYECIQNSMYSYFVPKAGKAKVLNKS